MEEGMEEGEGRRQKEEGISEVRGGMWQQAEVKRVGRRKGEEGKGEKGEMRRVWTREKGDGTKEKGDGRRRGADEGRRMTERR